MRAHQCRWSQLAPCGAAAIVCVDRPRFLGPPLGAGAGEKVERRRGQAIGEDLTMDIDEATAKLSEQTIEEADKPGQGRGSLQARRFQTLPKTLDHPDRMSMPC